MSGTPKYVVLGYDMDTVTVRYWRFHTTKKAAQTDYNGRPEPSKAFWKFSQSELLESENIKQ